MKDNTNGFGSGGTCEQILIRNQCALVFQ
jgi:hypothetical protein